VAAQDDAFAGLASRQLILASGFALLVGLLGAASFLAARATSRELAVARLQADFVSAVSHEFRSPLSSICQIAELLNEDRLPSDEQRRRSFAILGQESARLRRLVEGLLDFARMEAGVERYRLEPSLREKWCGPWSRSSRPSLPRAATKSAFDLARAAGGRRGPRGARPRRVEPA